MISAQAAARESEGMRLRSKGGDMTMRTNGAKGHDVSRALHASDGDINGGESGLVDGQASNRVNVASTCERVHMAKNRSGVGVDGLHTNISHGRRGGVRADCNVPLTDGNPRSKFFSGGESGKPEMLVASVSDNTQGRMQLHIGAISGRR